MQRLVYCLPYNIGVRHWVFAAPTVLLIVMQDCFGLLCCHCLVTQRALVAALLFAVGYIAPPKTVYAFVGEEGAFSAMWLAHTLSTL